MTSMDVVDNADAIRVRQSLDLILAKLKILLMALAGQIEDWANTPVMGFTHLQPAEPSTLGYRLAQYAQDLLMDWENISRLRDHIKGKGLKGAVGTSASYAELLGREVLPELEDRLGKLFGLDFFTATTQVYPRKQDYDVISALAGFGASINKFAFDLRILQSPPYGELSEPFGKKQVGSSAMPFKRNPVKAESANSLARLLVQKARVAWDNAALTLLERTLDDSANRRTILPEAFLIADELVCIAIWICEGLRVDERRIAHNLATYGSFAATERVLMALVKAGANRQEMHEHIRQLTLESWEALSEGQHNPLVELIIGDRNFLRFLSADELYSLMDATGYIGDAAERAKALAKKIRAVTGT
jgi:adenylosuccinate lyase